MGTETEFKDATPVPGRKNLTFQADVSVRKFGLRFRSCPRGIWGPDSAPGSEAAPFIRIQYVPRTAFVQQYAREEIGATRSEVAHELVSAGCTAKTREIRRVGTTVRPKLNAVTGSAKKRPETNGFRAS